MVLHFIYFKLFTVCVRVCICACVYMCVRARVYVRVHACTCHSLCAEDKRQLAGVSSLLPRVSWDSNQTLGFMVALSEPFCQAGIAFSRHFQSSQFSGLSPQIMGP